MHQMPDDNGYFSKKHSYKSRRTVIIGGTFNQFHQGHKDYIKLAVEFANEVYIFLSSDSYAQICKSCLVESYEIRKEYLENYLNEINGHKKYTIYELNSEHSLIQFCLENEINMAIVSPQYYSLFTKINRIREDEGNMPLLLLVKQRAKDSDGCDINSTFLKNSYYHKRMTQIENTDGIVHLTRQPI